MIFELNNTNNLFKYRYLLVDNIVVLNPVEPLSKEELIDLFGEDPPFGEKKLTQVLRSDLDYTEQKRLPLDNKVIMQATQLVEQAYQLGLTDANDIQFWVLNGLRYQTAFTQHPNVLEQIAKAEKEPSTFSKHVINAQIHLEISSLSINE
ncbi:hypothetical protein A9G33_03575 [Gilliamella sp. Choc3-5]|uniref:hypothetical protein n=1 Tax=Gilliamella sp. Choc3-5 TaxID=3120236 RepID=UPI00080DD602|nr:hypothetical protein [Gilliamella apicola]OCG32453.1 hypothetical protein A9G33_03575 [Gilliamella apicola]